MFKKVNLSALALVLGLALAVAAKKPATNNSTTMYGRDQATGQWINLDQLEPGASFSCDQSNQQVCKGEYTGHPDQGGQLVSAVEFGAGTYISAK